MPTETKDSLKAELKAVRDELELLKGGDDGAEHPVLMLLKVPEGMRVELAIRPEIGEVPQEVKDGFALLGYTVVEKVSEAGTEGQAVGPILSAERIEFAEQCIREGKIAQLIENPEGPAAFGWTGPPNWPIFIGYPWSGHVGNMPWPLVKLREDLTTHCTVFVQP